MAKIMLTFVSMIVDWVTETNVLGDLIPLLADVAN